MDEKLELNLYFTKFTKPNHSRPTPFFSPPPPPPSPSSVIHSYMNLNSPFPIMPSTPSSSSFSPSSISHTSASSPPSSSPSTGLPSPDANVNATARACSNVNSNQNAVHDLPLPPPAPPTSSACAACKYQRRKCGPQCMLAPYFPAERQQEFQNAHRLFGVSNIVKKLRKITLSERQSAIESMVIEANAHASDPSGGCYRTFLSLQTYLKSLNENLERVQSYIALCKGRQVNSEIDPQEQPYAGLYIN
jgi:Lateral organ boundaries (LOB) domain